MSKTKIMCGMNKIQEKGFTLIELLIVIAILAVLATVVLLVINPVQMFAQARDSQRVSDLGNLSNATALYLTTVVSPDLDHTGGFACGTHFGATIAGAVENFTAALSLYGAFGRAVDGLGWVPVNYGGISGGSPLSALPIDPINTAVSGHYYTYACDNTNKWFEFNASLESVRYSNGGPEDLESRDGGTNVDIYEVGNAPGLNL